MAVGAKNTKERLLRQDLQDKLDFFKIFYSIKFILLILSNKRLNGAKLFLWTTLQNNVHGKAGGIQYARNKQEKLDLIEKHNNIRKIVDPVFGCWLRWH